MIVHVCAHACTSVSFFLKHKTKAKTSDMVINKYTCMCMYDVHRCTIISAY